MAHYKGWYEAPRWAKFKKYLTETCFYHDLDLEIDIDKGFIRESGVFKVTGSEKDVSRFITEYHQTAELYNNG